jgi:acyl carrier protein
LQRDAELRKILEKGDPMITDGELRSVIAEVVPTVDVAKLPADAAFASSGIDSLDHAAILLLLQERYGLVVPDEDIARTISIVGILAYAAERCSHA